MTDNLELEKTLWQAADKLRNNMDAAEYKHVVLGLKFLKYKSDVRKNNYILTPGRYIDFKEVAEDGIAFDEKMSTLTQTLKEQMQKANELDEAIKYNLAKIDYAL